MVVFHIALKLIKDTSKDVTISILNQNQPKLGHSFKLKKLKNGIVKWKKTCVEVLWVNLL